MNPPFGTQPVFGTFGPALRHPIPAVPCPPIPIQPITIRSLAAGLPPPPSAEDVIKYGMATDAAADLRNDRRVITLLRIECPPTKKPPCLGSVSFVTDISHIHQIATFLNLPAAYTTTFIT
jgi:hypothetical protein